MKKPQTFSITMTLTTDPTATERTVTEAQVRKILKDALNPDKISEVVDKITFEVVDMTESRTYQAQRDTVRLPDQPKAARTLGFTKDQIGKGQLTVDDGCVMLGEVYLGEWDEGMFVPSTFLLHSDPEFQEWVDVFARANTPK